MAATTTGSTDGPAPPIPRLGVPPDVRLYVDVAGFEALCPHSKDLRLERTADGLRIVGLPYPLDPAWRIAEIGARLWSWSKRTGLGEGFSSSAGYLLPNEAIRGPVLSWMTRERWSTVSNEERDRPAARAVPDFVVEMQHPFLTTAAFRAKMAEYIAQGVRLAWLIDPETQTVEVHRPGRDVEVLTKPASLDGEDVLPGFTLDLKGILFD